MREPLQPLQSKHKKPEINPANPLQSKLDKPEAKPASPLQSKLKKPEIKPANPLHSRIKRTEIKPPEPLPKEIKKEESVKPKPRTPLVRSRSKRWVLLFLFLVVITMGTSVGLVVAYINAYLDQLETITYLEDYRPWMPSRLFSGDDQNVMFADFFNEKQNREMVPLASMPKNLLNAVVDLEDKRFYQHFGISVPDVIRAMYINIKSRKNRTRSQHINNSVSGKT